MFLHEVSIKRRLLRHRYLSVAAVVLYLYCELLALLQVEYAGYGEGMKVSRAWYNR